MFLKFSKARNAFTYKRNLYTMYWLSWSQCNFCINNFSYNLLFRSFSRSRVTVPSVPVLQVRCPISRARARVCVCVCVCVWVKRNKKHLMFYTLVRARAMYTHDTCSSSTIFTLVSKVNSQRSDLTKAVKEQPIY